MWEAGDQESAGNRIQLLIEGKERPKLFLTSDETPGSDCGEVYFSTTGREVKISEVQASSSPNASFRVDIRRQISSSSLEDFYSCSEDGSENTYGTVSHSPPRLHSGIRVSCLDSNGHIKIMESNEIDHLMKLHEIDVSDLEMLGLDQDTKEAAHTIITKDNAFLIGLLDIRCLVTEDSLYLFHSGTEAEQEFLRSISLECQRIAGCRTQNDRESNNGDLTTEEQNKRVCLPFRWTFIKTILASTDRKLIHLSGDLKTQYQNTRSSLSINLNEAERKRLIDLKVECIQFQSTSEGVQTILKDILQDGGKLDELLFTNYFSQEDQAGERDSNDVAHHQDSRHPGNEDNNLATSTRERRTLNEKKLVKKLKNAVDRSIQCATNLELKAKRISACIHAWEETGNIFLAARSFSHNRSQIRLSVVALVATLGAILASIFGMNMDSKLEESFIGFCVTTGLIAVLCVILCIVILKYINTDQVE